MRHDDPDTRRLPSETWDVVVGENPQGVPPHPGFPIAISIARDKQGKVHEIVIVERGKIGSDTDRIFADIAVIISRLCQNRNPITGEDL
jgi:hypothetical protein